MTVRWTVRAAEDRRAQFARRPSPTRPQGRALPDANRNPVGCLSGCLHTSAKRADIGAQRATKFYRPIPRSLFFYSTAFTQKSRKGRYMACLIKSWVQNHLTFKYEKRTDLGHFAEYICGRNFLCFLSCFSRQGFLYNPTRFVKYILQPFVYIQH